MIRAAQEGCTESMGQLFAAYRPFLLAIARETLDEELRAKANPSDLVQQTFIEAQRDLGRAQLRGEDDLRAWLRKLLIHNVADFKQSYRRAKRSIRREVPVDAVAEEDFLATLSTGDAETPSRAASTREELARIEAALSRLSIEYRQVILWHNREHFSFVEIGARLNRSPDAVRMLWNRAVQRLKEELEGDGESS